MNLNNENLEQPLVSIIMGAYNEEKTITHCIESIICQTYNNWEFIICDDCSTDGTLEILKEYAKRDNRIIIMNNESNLGLAATLNLCLTNANGKYIARMDADDICLSERLEIQVKYLEEHSDIDCVGCNMIVFDGYVDKGVRIQEEKPTKEMLISRTPFFHPTILMKKSVYDALEGYKVSKETVRAEDLDLWFRFYEREYKGYNIQIPLYKYHESQDDFKKRTIKAAIGTSKVYWNGYKILGFPQSKYIYALKPIIAALLPNNVISYYHKRKLE